MGLQAIILAAGEGTRMKSAKPKVLHEVLGKPMVRWVVDAAHEAGVEDVVCVLGHGREAVEPIVACDARVAVQAEQRGTADAVAAAVPALAGATGSLLVLSGDCPLITPQTIAVLAQARDEADAGVVVLTMKVDDPTGYGRIVRDAQGQVERIVEQKDCAPEQAQICECNSGFYCFDAELLFDALGKVDTNNAQGEFYLTDVIEIARKAGRAVVAYTADAAECLGVNTRVQLAAATKIMQRRINERHMLAGVTMLDPDTVWIGPDVTIDPDVEILPQVMLAGKTHIGTGTVVGPCSRLTDTTVGRNCTIDETVAIETTIDNDVDCGPRAYLRPQTHLCDGSKAGTHVEIKKSTIGKGSKVPHLSYIGDTTMGSGVNIGAGSITCNYDGEKKWPTTIGDDSFVGSDTMMVAPVNLGAHVLVGAGSVITQDVPDYALALGRARQVVKPDRNRPVDD
ncbi:MAG: bifunctional UDP-N-acetylglucosamine diphosphorylase/glucosamine-1-phosphate N-acetyltransferase GlmU [Eggerthellaceae bacterium]|nr:bifunctional UDP-N-acetylglucosamine diphosphorylase/glucosamine-1-phosphate N-acetyltransferase GlmU [Eggerthellaceae bacterium]